MYQPYPTGTRMPEVQRPPIPPQVINAVRTMYVGAEAASLLAKACQRGQSWARITGTVLFALATVDTLIALSAPIAGAVKLWALVTWLAGLTAVIFLWQRPSTAFFKGANNQ
jgi:hypothetical protein